MERFLDSFNKRGYTYLYENKKYKQQGKRLQNSVRDILLETFTQLEEDDIKSTTMGESGEDIQLSPVN